jgi:hypothetical protein
MAARANLPAIITARDPAQGDAVADRLRSGGRQDAASD